MFAAQIKYPENFFLLRGNHECASINRIYGFYDECKRRYNIRLWKTFTDCFNCLPVAALVDEKVSRSCSAPTLEAAGAPVTWQAQQACVASAAVRNRGLLPGCCQGSGQAGATILWPMPLQILCMHGGLSPELKSLEQIKRIPRPTDVPDTGLLCDLLWADPDKDVQARIYMELFMWSWAAPECSLCWHAQACGNGSAATPSAWRDCKRVPCSCS